MSVKISMVQLDIRWESVDYNLSKIEMMLERAVRPDLILLPETFATGFAPDPHAVAEQYGSVTGVEFMRRTARRFGCAVSGTLVVEDRGVTESGGCLSGLKIADLTGGLGVDTWAFSRVASAVLYNEMNSRLADAAEKNFRMLGAENITVMSRMLDPGTSTQEILGDFRPDLVFLDPARRDGDGRKVFLLEDCSPDILKLKDGIFRLCRYILLKLSPMADISMLLERLGKECMEVHILAVSGECKEVVILMDRDFRGKCRIVVNSGASSVDFLHDELRDAVPDYICGTEDLCPGALLYEPGKALMKAGAFDILGRRFPLRKLARFTHYYIYTGSPSDIPQELRDNGSFFSIIEAMPLNNRTVRETSRKYLRGEVTARNLKMDTDTLRRKLGISPGPDVHIFGLRCISSTDTGNSLIITVPL